MAKLSIIQICRDVGRFLHPSIQSVQLAIKRLPSEVGNVQWLCVLNSPSNSTEVYLRDWLPQNVQMVKTASQTVSECLKVAIEKATGQHLMVISSDYLIAGNFLSESLNASISDSRLVAFHPGAIVSYGNTVALRIIPDQEDPDFSLDSLITSNPWPDVSFGKREVFASYTQSSMPVVASDAELHWYWVCESISTGVVHKPLLETIACYRASGDNHVSMPTVPATNLFKPQWLPQSV